MENEPQNDPETAADTSVLAVLGVFADAGWTANHTSDADGAVRCGACGAIRSATEWTVGARHRAEGASDPADMQIVFGLTCPACGANGALLLSYGPSASDQDQRVLVALPDHDDTVDPMAAPTN